MAADALTPPAFASTDLASAAVKSSTIAGLAGTAVQGATLGGAGAAAVKAASGPPLPGQAGADKRTPAFVPKPSARGDEQGAASIASGPPIRNPRIERYYNEQVALASTPLPEVAAPPDLSDEGKDEGEARPDSAAPLDQGRVESAPPVYAPSSGRSARSGFQRPVRGPASAGRHPLRAASDSAMVPHSDSVTGQATELADAERIARQRETAALLRADDARTRAAELSSKADQLDREARSLSPAKARKRRSCARHLRRLAERVRQDEECERRKERSWGIRRAAVHDRRERLTEHRGGPEGTGFDA